MSEYPWKEKNNTFTWLNSLYNPVNGKHLFNKKKIYIAFYT